jgi:short-subunit dehydrogenase
MSHEVIEDPPDRGIALVTGATAGIGHEFAAQLAARGHDLVLVARDAERLEKVAAELRSAYGVTVEVLPADLADPDDLARVEARVAADEHPVELLVNNAGFGLKGRFLDNDIADEERMLQVLVVAVLRLTHAALGAMTARGHGQVVNVSSVAAYLPRGTYAAAKAWVNSFTLWAHGEYAGHGVDVMLLCPGFVKTEFHERMGVTRGSAPGFLWLTPERLVRDALADLDEGKARSLPSKRFKVITGVARLVPRPALHRLQGLGRR